MSETLWAPWRMDYILGIDKTPDAATSCIFCTFQARGPEHFREDLVLVVQPHAYVILNRYPFAPGHLLVCPRRHVAKLADLTEEEYDGLMRLLRAATSRLDASARPQGMNVGFNFGRAGGAGIADHLHAHVVPRWNGDSNFMPVIADVRVMPEYLDVTWRRLRAAFEGVPGTKAPPPEPGT